MSDIQYNEAAGTAPTADVHIVDETLEQSPFGRLVRVESADGTGYYDAYEYVPFNPADMVYGDGRVMKAAKGSLYSNTYTYDALGRVSATVLEKGGQTVGSSSNAWDTLGRLTGMTNLLGEFSMFSPSRASGCPVSSSQIRTCRFPASGFSGGRLIG